jgi:amino acid adenylation domain-containing protein
MSILVFDRKMVEQQQYWLQRLAAGLEPSAPRQDELRPDTCSGKKGRVRVDVSAAVSSRINELTKGSFLTGTVLLAALMACLYKYCGNNAVVVGTPSRKPEDGSLDNALAIIEMVKPDLAFRDLLMGLRQTLLDAYANQGYPHDHLLQELGWERPSNRCPLFNVAFAYDAIHDPLPDLNNDITFLFSASEQGIDGWIDYNSDLYRQDSMELMSRHFLHLLEQGVGDPTMTITQMTMVPSDQLRQTLAGWNDTQTNFPDNHAVISLIEEQAVRYSESPALVFAGQSLSYQQMMKQVDAIAVYLAGLNVGPEVLVGVCLKDPLQTVLTILGIIKAGGAFLPLDQTYPQERIAFMLDDSGAALLVAEPDTSAAISSHKAKLVDPQTLFAATRREAGDGALMCPAGPENAAYVIYTSGSTGRPKGTLLEHRGLCNLARAQSRTFAISDASRVLQFASLSFDASVSEIFMTLCSGAALHLAGHEEMQPGQPLLSLLRDQKITHITLPPSVLAVMPLEPLADLSGLIVAGEACPVDVAEKWSQGRDFFNAYGPTESTVCATISTYKGSGRPLIGRPIDNTRIHILDGALEPVAIGVPGELHIQSVGLARHYINQADLSAEKFIDSPLADEPGQRLYKSGDLARWLANGEIEFLGRVDHQVKVRGFRIEPDEIAANLGEHAGVKNSVVIAREDDLGEPRIVAYVVPEDPDMDCAELRDFLKQKLPEYMLPSHIIALEQLPLLANGKIDRKALPHPGTITAGTRKNGGSARDTQELLLVRIWREILNREAVGVRDDFFAVGGHSLLAVKLMSRIQQEFERKLPLDLLFTHPTIEALARELRRQPGERAPWSALVTLQSANASSRRPLFCVHPAGGRALCYVKLSQALGVDQPLYGFQARGLDEGQQPFVDIVEMASTYLAALKKQQPEGPYQILGWSGGGVVAFEIARQLQGAGDEVSFLCLVDAYAPSALPAHLKEQDEAELIKALLSEEIPSASLDELRSMSRQERLVYLCELLTQADLIPPDFGVVEVERFFEVYKVNCRLAHSPVSVKFDGTPRLFRANQEQTLRELYTPDDASLGWQGHAGEEVEIIDVEGTHNSILEEPHVAGFAAALKTFLS